MKKGWLILITIINLLLLGYLIWCFVSDPYGRFTGEDITSLLGTIVSCISIVITAFFVLLAIDVYGKIREIDEAKRKADMLTETVSSAERITNEAKEDADILAGYVSSAQETLAKTETQIEDFQLKKQEFEKLSADIDNQYESNKQRLSEMALEMFDVLNLFTEEATSYAEKIKNGEIREQTLGVLYRFSYKYPDLLDESTRLRYLLNLSVFGDTSDVEHLEKLCEVEAESSKIKEAARAVIDEIIKREAANKQKK